jgi:hypothetical protein
LDLTGHEKFMQALENVAEKSSLSIRTIALQQLYDLLMHHTTMPDFVDERKIPLMNIVEKSVREGNNRLPSILLIT